MTMNLIRHLILLGAWCFDFLTDIRSKRRAKLVRAMPCKKEENERSEVNHLIIT
ncbi:MAG: hypothetical protein RR137_04320 [Odoribacter sp.]